MNTFLSSKNTFKKYIKTEQNESKINTYMQNLAIHLRKTGGKHATGSPFDGSVFTCGQFMAKTFAAFVL